MFLLGGCSDEHEFITHPKTISEKNIPKIFILTGYLSRNRLGAWYLQNKRITRTELYCQAVGGHFLKQEKAHIVAHLDEIMITNGLINLLINIPSYISKINQLATHITTHGFKEVVLIDVSWITIPLARKLKKIDPTIHITLIAAPELWFWGRW
jgi:lipid A disaccharide synthetase